MPSTDRRDADARDDFATRPQCPAAARYFALGCQGAGWRGNPEVFPAQIAPGCYHPCTRAFDPICGAGTRCGRAAIAPLACNGANCAPICAETWLCLARDLFESEEGDASVDLDVDAGFVVDDYDAGRFW